MDVEDSSNNSPRAGAPATASATMFLAVGICCLSPVLFGFSLGFTSPTQNVMQGNRVTPVNVTAGEHRFHPPHNLIVFSKQQENLYAAMLNIGAVIGAFSGSVLGDRLGRRSTLVLTAVPHFISWVGTCYIPVGWSYTLIGLRLLLGWAVGVGSAVMPSYIGEVSTTDYRGALGAANQLSVTIGIFLSAMVGKYFFLIEKHDVYFTQWRYMSLVGAGLAVVLCFAMLVPESPQWLAKHKGRTATKAALKRLRKGNVDQEVNEIMASNAAGDKGSGGGGSVIGQLCGEYKKSLIIGVGLCVAQQLSGINAVIFYTVDICRSAGMANPRMMAMYSMLFQVLLTGVAVLLMEKAGRRGLLLLACSSMAVALYMLATYYHLQDGYNACMDSYGDIATATNVTTLADDIIMPGCSKPPSAVAIAGLVIFIAGFSIGMGPIPWLILAEIFPTDVRGTASSIATAVNWSMSFIVTLAFAPMIEAIGSFGVFLFFAIVVTVAFVFVFLLVPETKGKTVEEVLVMLQEGEAPDSEDEEESDSDETSFIK